MGYLDVSELDRMWDFSDPAASEVRFQTALTTQSPPAQDEVRTQLARALGLQGKFDDGHAVLNAISSTDAVVNQRIALERGRLFNSAGDSATASEQFKIALNIGADEYLSVDSLHMLAIVQPDKVNWYTQAMEMVSDSNDPRVARWEGSLLNNQAWNLADCGQEEAALDAFQRAET